ncbi:MAG: acyltransferase, partial [Synechococcus lacustris]|nr:acyltransferase [Synechococcus lacustris]
MIQGHRLPFRADIQALRGVAVLAVLIFHLFPDLLPGGYGGVDLFFVISGYVVTYALLARQAKDPDREMGFSDYFKRRLRRIMPPLLVALLIIAAISYLIYDKRLFHSFSGYSITGLLGVSNLKLISQQTNYFSPDEYLNPYLHTWSLGIEEQFYLIFPLIFLPFVRTERRWHFWLAAGALWFASFLLAWHWSQVAAERAYLSPLSRFWELATGVLLALAGVTSRFKRLLAKFKKFSGLIQVFALLLLLLSFALLSNKGSYPMPGVVLPVLASAVLLGFGAGT